MNYLGSLKSLGSNEMKTFGCNLKNDFQREICCMIYCLTIIFDQKLRLIHFGKSYGWSIDVTQFLASLTALAIFCHELILT